MSTRVRALADESLFYHVMFRIRVRAFFEPEPFKNFLDVFVEIKAAADHAAVGFNIDAIDTKVREHCAVLQQLGNAAHLGALFTGGGWVINDLGQIFLADQLVHHLVVLDIFDQAAAILQLGHFAGGVSDDDLFKVLIGFRFA
jgi:hypothetical protein